MALRFTWDAKKAAANREKHHVDLLDARTAFEDPLSVTIADPAHSIGEQRFLLIGSTQYGHLVVVAHAERRDEIRIVSARAATRRERRIYEEEP